MLGRETLVVRGKVWHHRSPVLEEIRGGGWRSHCRGPGRKEGTDQGAVRARSE